MEWFPAVPTLFDLIELVQRHCKNIGTLNDIIEGSLEPESGWIKKVLAIENTPLLAIENSTN